MSDVIQEHILFSNDRGIHPFAIQQLRESIGWQPDVEEVWKEVLESAIAVASIQSSDRLLGIGFLTGTRRHATICDLAVHPTAQQRGFGRQIVTHLVQVARDEEIPYITLLYDTNNPWLKDFYESTGFEIVTNAMLLSRPVDNA